MAADEPASATQSASDAEAGSAAEAVYAEAARHFLDVQISTHDILDGKSAQAFSVGSVVLPVTFALLNLGSRSIPWVAEWALGSALIFYVLMLACAIRANRMRELEFRPNMPTLKQHSLHYLGRTLERWVADEYERSVRVNSDLLKRKALWVGRATLMLHLEAISLSIAALSVLLR